MLQINKEFILDAFDYEFIEASLEATVEVEQDSNVFNVLIIGKSFATYNKEAGKYYKQLRKTIQKVLDSKRFLLAKLSGSILDIKVISNYSEKFIITITASE